MIEQHIELQKKRKLKLSLKKVQLYLSLSFKHLLPAIHARLVFNVLTPVSNVTQFLILV